MTTQHRILVAGLINIETTAKVDSFPIEYSPVRYPFFGVRSTVSGVGYNVAKALTRLERRIEFLSLVGDDDSGSLIAAALERDRIPHDNVITALRETPQSVILYDADGRRQINVDLKDIQDATYPHERARAAIAECEWAILCNINFTRPMLRAATELGKQIATDVHAISDLNDDYNRDYMEHADVLFMSHERLPVPPAEWLTMLAGTFPRPKVMVVGMGAEGAMLFERASASIATIPARATRPIVNTIGAGDSLFSAFIDGYSSGLDARTALSRAAVFASWKIGEAGAACGLLSRDELENLRRRDNTEPQA